MSLHPTLRLAPALSAEESGACRDALGGMEKCRGVGHAGMPLEEWSKGEEWGMLGRPWRNGEKAR